jgi:hypothetical protein
MTSILNTGRKILGAIAWGYVAGVVLALPYIPASMWPVYGVVLVGAVGAAYLTRREKP